MASANVLTVASTHAIQASNNGSIYNVGFYYVKSFPTTMGTEFGSAGTTNMVTFTLPNCPGVVPADTIRFCGTLSMKMAPGAGAVLPGQTETIPRLTWVGAHGIIEDVTVNTSFKGNTEFTRDYSRQAAICTLLGGSDYNILHGPRFATDLVYPAYCANRKKNARVSNFIQQCNLGWATSAKASATTVSKTEYFSIPLKLGLFSAGSFDLDARVVGSNVTLRMQLKNALRVFYGNKYADYSVTNCYLDVPIIPKPPQSIASLNSSSSANVTVYNHFSLFQNQVFTSEETFELFPKAQLVKYVLIGFFKQTWLNNNDYDQNAFTITKYNQNAIDEPAVYGATVEQINPSILLTLNGTYLGVNGRTDYPLESQTEFYKFFNKALLNGIGKGINSLGLIPLDCLMGGIDMSKAQLGINVKFNDTGDFIMSTMLVSQKVVVFKDGVVSMQQ